MLTVYIINIILFNAFTTRKDLSLIFNRSLIALLIVSFLVGLKSNNFLILKKGVCLLGGLFHNTSLSITFHLFIMFISLIIIQLTAFLPRSFINNTLDNLNKYIDNLIYNLELSNKTKQQYTIIEYPLIILFIIVGAMFLISCNDIISIFLSIELQSYGLYLLCALYRNSESSTGASLIYFLLGGLSSCFILLSFAILYGNSGTSSLSSYYLLTNLSDSRHIISSLYLYSNSYISYCLVILSIGFLFKISAAPFHFWSPDVYDAIPTIVTTFVAAVAKISILILLIEIVHYTGDFAIYNFNWSNCLLISSLLSLIVGTVLGLNQSRIKRLLAYSTISHLGFMLLAISVSSTESIQAFIFYLMQYSISNVNTFILIISIGYTIYMYERKEKDNKQLIDENNSPIQYTTQLKGYYFINPVIAISLTIAIYSFVGVPPLIGFFAKQMVLSSALDKGYIFISLVAILTSVIGAVYYLNIIKEMFFFKSDYKLYKVQYEDNKNTSFNETKKIYLNNNITILSTNLTITISLLTLIILLFMLNSEEWLRMSNILAITTFR